MSRAILPQRRLSETVEFRFAETDFTATFGFQPDGRIGEVFLNAQKRDCGFDHMARDTAILISFALQQGVALGDLRRAMTRDALGAAQGLAGFVLDRMEDGA